MRRESIARLRFPVPATRKPANGLLLQDDVQHALAVEDAQLAVDAAYVVARGAFGYAEYAIDYPINMAGNSNGRALTWGYLIGDILSK